MDSVGPEVSLNTSFLIKLSPSPSLFSLEIAELQAFRHDIDEMWLKLNSCLDSPPMVKSGCFKSSPKVPEPVDKSSEDLLFLTPCISSVASWELGAATFWVV